MSILLSFLFLLLPGNSSRLHNDDVRQPLISTFQENFHANPAVHDSDQCGHAVQMFAGDQPDRLVDLPSN